MRIRVALPGRRSRRFASGEINKPPSHRILTAAFPISRFPALSLYRFPAFISPCYALDMTHDPPPASEPVESQVPDTVAIPPDHRDMYLLIAGLILGLILSPWIMGRFMDDVSYQRWYMGGGEAVTAYNEFMKTHVIDTRAKDNELLDRLKSTGVTKEAVDEMRAKLQDEARAQWQPYYDAAAVEREAHAAWQRGFMVSLVAAMIVLMLMEPVFELAGSMATVRRRLVTGRYGLIAVWIVYALAKPHALTGIPWAFAMLAVLVIVVATLLPLLVKRIATEANQ